MRIDREMRQRAERGLCCPTRGIFFCGVISVVINPTIKKALRRAPERKNMREKTMTYLSLP